MGKCVDGGISSVRKQELIVERVGNGLKAWGWGRENSINLQDLAVYAFCSSRAVRQAIKTLIEEQGWPIGSSSDPDRGGYYLIMNKQEQQSAVQQIQGRIESLQARLDALQNI